MLYRILRGITEIYGRVWLFIFIAMFFVAFAFTVNGRIRNEKSYGGSCP